MILGKSRSDDAVLTFSSERETLPASSVQRPQPREIWRSFDNSDQHLIFDFGVSGTLNCAAVLYHNGDASAQWRIRVAATEGLLISSPDYDSGLLNMRRGSTLTDRYERFHSVHPFTVADRRWARIDFTSLSGMTTLDVGRVMFMDAMTNSAAYGFTYSVGQDVEPIATVGALWTRSGRKFRTVQFSYPVLSDDDAWRRQGVFEEDIHNPVLMSITENHTGEREVDWTFYGYLSDVTNNYVYRNINQRTYTMNEIERP